MQRKCKTQNWFKEETKTTHWIIVLESNTSRKEIQKGGEQMEFSFTTIVGRGNKMPPGIFSLEAKPTQDRLGTPEDSWRNCLVSSNHHISSIHLGDEFKPCCKHFFQSQPFAGRIFCTPLWQYLPCGLGQHVPPLTSTFFTATEARVVVRTNPLSFHVPDHSGQRKHHGDHWPRWWLRRWSLRLCTWWQAGIWYGWPFSAFFGCTWCKSLIVLQIILFCSPCTFPFVRPFLGPQT